MTERVAPTGTGTGTDPAARPTAPHGGLLLAGRYRLRDRIGRGATADVWSAVDESLRRPVAVKLACPEAGPDAVGRLRAEAAAAGRITDPAVVAVYDVCPTPWGDALVLELVEGTTLRQELDRRGRLPVAEGLRLGAAVARALGVVHRAGLVHRDVKPGNILLVEDRVKLADFGIADDVQATGGGGGTPKYVAPEQLVGAPVDPRADLYSLGAVLYEALAGRAPFLDRDDAATAAARLQRDPPSVRSGRPEVPVAVDAYVLRLLSRDPASRPATATEVATSLEALADQVPSTVDPDPQEGADPGWWIPVLVLVLVAAACVALAVTLFVRARSDATEGDALVVPSADGVDDGAGETGEPLFPTTGIAGTVATVEALDPFGDGEEHDDELRALLDGDPMSAWTTETYRTAEFGGLKPGLGLVVRVDDQVAALRLDSSTPGWSATVHQASGAEGGPEAWGEPIDLVASANPTVEIRLAAGGGDVLVWFTSLPATDAGYELHITAVTAVP